MFSHPPEGEGIWADEQLHF